MPPGLVNDGQQKKVAKGKVSLNPSTQGGGIQNIDTVSCYRKANLPSADILSLFLTTLDLNVSSPVLLADQMVKM